MNDLKTINSNFENTSTNNFDQSHIWLKEEQVVFNYKKLNNQRSMIDNQFKVNDQKSNKIDNLKFQNADKSKLL